eukprot:TRINITY_DN67682_c7_g2_i1.p1 TRINITY_DN67682_c7_g2~~TRINITY_DN67682_c7_g2_i1.p1  ORF type:complete len:793 (-),score=84.52 TRINITY_DN67682_c7_g2_i1:771-3020(-)
MNRDFRNICMVFDAYLPKLAENTTKIHKLSGKYPMGTDSLVPLLRFPTDQEKEDPTPASPPASPSKGQPAANLHPDANIKTALYGLLTETTTAFNLQANRAIGNKMDRLTQILEMNNGEDLTIKRRGEAIQQQWKHAQSEFDKARGTVLDKIAKSGIEASACVCFSVLRYVNFLRSCCHPKMKLLEQLYDFYVEQSDIGNFFLPPPTPTSTSTTTQEKQQSDPEEDQDKDINTFNEIFVNGRIHVYMIGPQYSPYHEELVKLIIQLPKNYPRRPPKVTINHTPFYHPNVCPKTGDVHTYALVEDGWDATNMDLCSVVRNVSDLLIVPDLEYPHPDCTELVEEYRDSHAEFDAKAAKMWADHHKLQAQERTVPGGSDSDSDDEDNSAATVCRNIIVGLRTEISTLAKANVIAKEKLIKLKKERNELTPPKLSCQPPSPPQITNNPPTPSSKDVKKPESPSSPNSGTGPRVAFAAEPTTMGTEWAQRKGSGSPPRQLRLDQISTPSPTSRHRPSPLKTDHLGLQRTPVRRWSHDDATAHTRKEAAAVQQVDHSDEEDENGGPKFPTFFARSPSDPQLRYQTKLNAADFRKHLKLQPLVLKDLLQKQRSSSIDEEDPRSPTVGVPRTPTGERTPLGLSPDKDVHTPDASKKRDRNQTMTQLLHKKALGQKLPPTMTNLNSTCLLLVLNFLEDVTVYGSSRVCSRWHNLIMQQQPFAQNLPIAMRESAQALLFKYLLLAKQRQLWCSNLPNLP